MRPVHTPALYRRKGFTFVEILLVSVLLVVILGVLVFVMISHQQSYLSMDASIQVSEETRRALDFMTRELRSAGGTVTAPAPVDYASFLEFQSALGYNSGIAGCPPNEGCWGAVGAHGPHHDWKIRYSIMGSAAAGGQLIREVRDDGNTVRVTRVLANKIDGKIDILANDKRTYFEYDATAKRVTIHLQVITPNNSALPGGTRSSGAITSQIELRN